MKYCTKCGNELRDTDLFCGKCGAKVEVIEEKEDFFSEQKTYTTSNDNIRKRNGLASAGFTFSFIGFALSIFMVWAFAINVTTDSSVDGEYLRYIRLASIFFSVFGLGLSIPGVIIGVKMQYKKARAISGVVFAGIALFTLFSLSNILH